MSCYCVGQTSLGTFRGVASRTGMAPWMSPGGFSIERNQELDIAPVA